jgi:two-component system response regulator PilR (NtrC family)
MGEQAKIVVIDDDETIRKSITTVLEGSGYLVDTARNGKEAIDKANSAFYNLALIDIRLPDMEGTQLLTALKETVPRMAKIMLTGYPSTQNAIDAVNGGADGYIVKPARMDELLRVVKEHLRRQQEAREYGEEKVKEFVESRVKELESKERDKTSGHK